MIVNRVFLIIENENGACSGQNDLTDSRIQGVDGGVTTCDIQWGKLWPKSVSLLWRASEAQV